MAKTRWSEYITVLRPVNCVLAAIAVLIGASIAHNTQFIFNNTILTAMASAFLICAGGQTINDYFDFEIDKRKGRHQFETKAHYLWYAIGLFAVGLAFSLLVNPFAFQIAGIMTILLIVYSGLLHRYKIFGNLIVALGTSLPLVFGATIFENYKIVLLLAASAFFANWAREIVKDVQDEEADRGKKITLPMLVRAHVLDWIVLGLSVIAIILAFVPVGLEWFGNLWYLILIGISSLFFLKAAWDFRTLKIDESQHTYKIAMAIALLGFLAGTFNG